MNAKYRIILCPTDDMPLEVHNVEPENLHAWCEVRGYKVMGVAARQKHLRAELRREPVISGLCGPMWDGGVIRYEDQRSNNYLSQ